MRDNEYDVQVYTHDDTDAAVKPLQRAMHAELCRIGKNGLHGGNVFPACYRAMKVAEQHYRTEMANIVVGAGVVADRASTATPTDPEAETT